MDEIKKTSTEDLIILRSSILAYLKSKKLKKRNSNYMSVFLRMNYELSQRKKSPKFITVSDIIKEIPQKKSENLQSEKIEKFEDFAIEKNLRGSELKPHKYFDFFEYEKNKEKSAESKFLNRKLSQDSHLEIDIPSFLNDKNSLKIKKLKESLQVNEKKILLNSINNPTTNISGKNFIEI